MPAKHLSDFASRVPRISSRLGAAVVIALASSSAAAQTAATYFPPRGEWQTRSPASQGVDSAKLQVAIDYALAHGSTWDFERDQVRTFGPPLGPLPRARASTNGVILRHGYVIARFGDTRANDPVYSIAKSFLSTVAGIAVQRGLIRNVDDRVADYVHDGGYDSPHNAPITWRNHLQQESEWEGSLWGKNADFIGREQFGNGARPPRAIREPGTYYEYNDVRINRFSLSLLRLYGSALSDVLASDVMNPIGASSEWRWVPYDNSAVVINGKSIGSVSGGTRWGGGLWINSEDLARFGLLALNRGNWNGRQVVSAAWFRDATTPSAHGPDYGYLWWLNTQRKQWPSAPASSFAALGNGTNIIWVDPDHDIVVVWRWFQNNAMDGLIQRIEAAVAPTGPTDR
jgi:CubicO group peptidase (beta-lactamase class C family)